MLKKSAGGVLASLRGSTLRGTPRIFEILKGLIRSPRLIARANGYTKCGPYLLTSSLAAALPDSLFEHPADDPALSIYLLPVDFAAQKLSFSANC
jgi:hypothetical protein